jgi:hypothetical protein
MRSQFDRRTYGSDAPNCVIESHARPQQLSAIGSQIGCLDTMSAHSLPWSTLVFGCSDPESLNRRGAGVSDTR